MADREKVIKGLECCFNPHSENSCLCHCSECPYDSQDDNNWTQHCQIKLNMDALKLLKEQEPVTYKVVKAGEKSYPFYDLVCTGCGNKTGMRMDWKYCPGCGRVVKWDA